MYPGANVIGGSVATGGGALAVTGPSSIWVAVAGVTLILAGLALTRLLPNRRRNIAR